MTRTYDWAGHTHGITFPHYDDHEAAMQIRMLTRSDLNHEPVVLMARDRIMALVKEKEELQKALDAARAFIDSHVADPDLTEEMCETYTAYNTAIDELDARGAD